MQPISSKNYDYIIAGAGAAGLSLLVRMINNGGFSNKRILLIDKEQKNKNDRTWCFWETGSGFFEEIVCKKWNRLMFHAGGFSKRLDIAPYSYKMIRGIDFYNYCMGIIAAHANVDVLYGAAGNMQSDAEGASLVVNGDQYTARRIFSSILQALPLPHQNEHRLLQHFKGWTVNTSLPCFDGATATLMDFRTSQAAGTSFVYTMPFSPTRALIEYTVFSGELLPPADYELALRHYISQFLPCGNYTVEAEEFGVIPMTNHPFKQKHGNIINIGTAGGQTKGSSGYTFNFIQKNAQEIVRSLLLNETNLALSSFPKRFLFYDSVLLNVLATGKLGGEKVFTALFSENPTDRIFRFLDNESTLADELRLISTLPTMPFLKAGIQQLV